MLAQAVEAEVCRLDRRLKDAAGHRQVVSTGDFPEALHGLTHEKRAQG